MLPGGNEAEWLTRKKRIDTKLRSLNPAWQIIPLHEGLDTTQLTRHAVTEFPTANGPADYALFVNGQLLGIIEAKKFSVNPQNVLEQAKRYAEGVSQGPGNWNGYRVPFLYATNMEIIWHLDVRPEKRVSRPVANFHTAPALEEIFSLKTKPAHDWLLDTPPERIARLRPYKIGAITATEAAIRSGRRELLVAMATGTGRRFSPSRRFTACSKASWPNESCFSWTARRSPLRPCARSTPRGSQHYWSHRQQKTIGELRAESEG